MLRVDSSISVMSQKMGLVANCKLVLVRLCWTSIPVVEGAGAGVGAGAVLASVWAGWAEVDLTVGA